MPTGYGIFEAFQVKIGEKCGLRQFESQRYKVLLAAEGFEERSLSVAAEVLGSKVSFQRIIVFKNKPERHSRLTELSEMLAGLAVRELEIVDFVRDDPMPCEEFLEALAVELSDANAEIYIDISVFSRLLIMMLVCAFRAYPGRIVVLYTEPEDYFPSEAQFNQWISRGQAELTISSSAGLQGVLRTVGLSSAVMVGEPCVVIAFTSFNAHLVGGLLRSMSPARFVLIGAAPPRLRWREKAALTIHSQIIEEYSRDNEIDADGRLVYRSSTLDYRETVAVLASLYQRFCLTHRIVVAPTGSKLQALGAGIFKAICGDVHIEYPMPAKYFATNYSSVEIRKIHQISFRNFSRSIQDVDQEFGLDGSWTT